MKTGKVFPTFVERVQCIEKIKENAIAGVRSNIKQLEAQYHFKDPTTKLAKNGIIRRVPGQLGIYVWLGKKPVQDIVASLWHKHANNKFKVGPVQLSLEDKARIFDSEEKQKAKKETVSHANPGESVLESDLKLVLAEIEYFGIQHNRHQYIAGQLSKLGYSKNGSK